jgi:hypothetical protein
MFSDILKPRSSFTVRNQVSHPYKTSKIILFLFWSLRS